MKRVIWYVVVVALTLVVLVVIWLFRISIVLFALSLAVAAALRPLINQIAMKTRSKRIALSLVYGIVIVSILALLVGGGQLLLQDLQKVTDDLATNYEHIKNDWPSNGSLFQRTLAERLPSSDDLYRTMTSEEGLLTLAADGGPGQDLFSIFGHIVIILVISMYWSADQLRFERLSVSLFQTKHRPKALHIWREIESGVGAYLRSELTQSVLAALLLGGGYWLIGLRYPALLATWGGIVRLVPWFGVLIAILPLLFFAASSPVSSFLAILYTIIVLLFLKTTVEPRYLEHQRNNSLLIVLFVIILAEAFGFIGVLLAPPLAVAVQILLQELYPIFAWRNSQELQEAIRLKNRLSQLRKTVRNPASRESMRFVDQLYQIVRQTISYMQRY